MRLLKTVIINFAIISTTVLFIVILVIDMSSQDLEILYSLDINVYILWAILMLIFATIISLRYIRVLDVFFMVPIIISLPGLLLMEANRAYLPFDTFDPVYNEMWWEIFDEFWYEVEEVFLEISLIMAFSAVFSQRLFQKKIKSPLLGSILVVFLLLSLLLSDIPPLPAFLRLNFLIVIIFFSVVLIASNETFQALKKYKKITNILCYEINPSKYINEIENFIEVGNYKELRWAGLFNMDKVDLAAGYIAEGDLNKAIVLLEEVSLKNADAYTVFLANYHLCYIFLSRNDIDKAMYFHNSTKELILNLKNNKEEYVAKNNMKYLESKFLLARHEYAEALEAYKKLESINSFTPISKINIRFDMAAIYEKLGMEKERSECLEYVSTHGNKCAKSILAKGLLRGKKNHCTIVI